MDTQTARQKTIEKLEELGLMEKIEDHPMVIPYGDRSGVVIEPLMTDQWFVDAPKLAVKAIEAVENGDMEFVPKSYEKPILNGCAISSLGAFPVSCGGDTRCRFGTARTAKSSVKKMLKKLRLPQTNIMANTLS